MPYAAPFAAPYGAAYGAAYGAPVGMNAYQAPTVWQGDHVVSGGQPEWAAEDAAQHALNLANWRIKLLQVRATWWGVVGSGMSSQWAHTVCAMRARQMPGRSSPRHVNAASFAVVVPLWASRESATPQPCA
jgi:hypothetical protein